MKKKHVLFKAVMAMFILLFFVPVFAGDYTQEIFVPGEVIALADSEEEAQLIADMYGLELLSCFEGVAVFGSPNPRASISNSNLMRSRMRNANLPVLSLNTIYTTSFGEMPVETSAASNNDTLRNWQHSAMDTYRAWDITQGAGVVVAVIDTGIYTDLVAFLMQNFPKAYNSFTNKTGRSNVNDDYGHGSHVSSIIADWREGVAPHVTIMPIKANTPNYGTFQTASVLRGINYAVENGAHIINLSLGREFSRGENAVERAVIANAVARGVIVFAAAGNESDDNVGYPAAYPEVIAVTALRWENGEAVFDDSYSNYGPQADLSAPGTDIFGPDYWGGGLIPLSGTSMASPNAAGVAALIKARNPSFTPQQIRERMTSTARHAGTVGKDLKYGYGMVNAYAALLGTGGLHKVTYHSSATKSDTVRVVPGGKLVMPDAVFEDGLLITGWRVAAAKDFCVILRQIFFRY